jgi:hypothetical protein
MTSYYYIIRPAIIIVYEIIEHVNCFFYFLMHQMLTINRVSNFIINVKANQTLQDNRFSSAYLLDYFSQLSILDVLIRQLHSESSS